MSRLHSTVSNEQLEVIGTLAAKAQTPPIGPPTVQLAWRTGYQNAMSDLIAMWSPESPGARRLSFDDIAAEDDRRAR